MNKIRAFAASAIFMTFLSAGLAIPIPHRVYSYAYLSPLNATPVFSKYPGFVDQVFVEPGDRVRAGDPIAQLSNQELLNQIQTVENEIRLEEVRKETTERLATKSSNKALELREVVETLKTLHAELETKREELKSLTLRAPQDGQIVSAPFVPKDKSKIRLAAWHGDPMESRNHGAFLERGTMFCLVIPERKKYRAVLLVSEEEIEFVRVGQNVDLFLNPRTGRPVRCSIEQISTVEVTALPASLAGKTGGPIPSTTDKEGREVPQSSLFQVSAIVEDSGDDVLINTTGTAKIYAGQTNVATLIWRGLCQTFSFDL